MTTLNLIATAFQNFAGMFQRKLPWRARFLSALLALFPLSLERESVVFRKHLGRDHLLDQKIDQPPVIQLLPDTLTIPLKRTQEL